MPLHSVSAGRITHIGYEDNTLYVRFVNDSLYAYYNVPIQEYQNLLLLLSYDQRPLIFLIRGVDNILFCAIISI